MTIRLDNIPSPSSHETDIRATLPDGTTADGALDEGGVWECYYSSRPLSRRETTEIRVAVDQRLAARYLTA